MKIEVRRVAKRETYTIGRLSIDGRYICDTLEDRVRPRGVKEWGETAIPPGTYRVTMSAISPRFSRRRAYQWCHGRLPRLLRVPGFEGILIHAGNTHEDTAGCLLVGENKVVGKVTNSMATLKKLWAILEEARLRDEPIELTIW